MRFPHQHVAESVVQRIIEAQKKFNSIEAQGQRLDQALAQPVGEVAAPDGIEEALVGRSLGV